MEHELWRKISAFNKSDPDVLGLNHDRHFQKVKEESYAYIIDYTPASFARSQDCAFATIDDRFNFMYPYSVAFPRNSALRDPFSGV